MISFVNYINTHSLPIASIVKGAEVLSSLMDTCQDYCMKEKTSQVAFQLFNCLFQASYLRNPFPKYQLQVDVLASTIHFLRKFSLKDWTWIEITGELIFRAASLFPLLEKTLPQRLIHMSLASHQIKIIQSSAYLIGGSLILIRRIPQLVSSTLFLLGMAYTRDLDDATAAECYLKAARLGYAPAQNELAWSYKSGIGVPQSNTEALNWYQKAANQGYATAQYNLGCMYQEGIGVTQSNIEAFKWFQKAANQGLAEAKDMLEKMKQEK